MVKNIGITVTLPKRSCEDNLCPFHGTLSVRGRMYTGIIESNSANKMIVVSREYNRKVKKYKRYERNSSKVHAFLPKCIDASEGQKVKIAECRPLSKTVSFVVVETEDSNGI